MRRSRAVLAEWANSEMSSESSVFSDRAFWQTVGVSTIPIAFVAEECEVSSTVYFYLKWDRSSTPGVGNGAGASGPWPRPVAPFGPDLGPGRGGATRFMAPLWPRFPYLAIFTTKLSLEHFFRLICFPKIDENRFSSRKFEKKYIFLFFLVLEFYVLFNINFFYQVYFNIFCFCSTWYCY